VATYLIKASHIAHQSEGFWSISKLLYLGSAIAAYGLGFIFYTFALKRLAMSLAYPVMTAITLLIIAIVGVLVLNEDMTTTKILGMLLIATGAFFLTR
jgi:multidrug transporter EmrE-like cation transporter